MILQNSENRTETGQLNTTNRPAKKQPIKRLPKTHQDHWLGRLRKRSYLAQDGKTEIEIPLWQVRLFQGSKEAWFNLGTANQANAAAKARDIYVYLKANGWEATLAKFKPESNVAARLNLTVGQFLDEVKASGGLELRTFLNYQNCLRTIISEAFGVRGDQSKYDYRTGGNLKWIGKIDRIRLERVTPARVVAWRNARVKKAGHSPVAIASAQRTCNSYVRCARSLFAKKILEELKAVKLPEKLPFDGVKLFKPGSQEYVSKINAQALIAAAKTELKANDPESYKAFLLGLFAGLRKGEIDLLEWGMIDWQNHVINLEETEWLHLKTEKSAAAITVEPELSAELQAFMPMARSRFVIGSAVTWRLGKKAKLRTRVRRPRNDSARTYYRCEPVFDRLNKWLRGKGVKANKPVHELRKEIGSLIVTEHGIYAASRFLRHSDITTTARHYADHKARISVGLGKLLHAERGPAARVVTRE